jgi:4-amino-4-deoxy-L-arabinose transferase-like glycosyltransferase
VRPTLAGTGGWLAEPWSRLARRLGTDVRELACVAGIILAGAVLRFVNLPVRGGWDSDQGTEMLALRAALSTGRLPTFGPEAISVTSSFHHGALYYDLLLPAAWLGNGDPIWVAAEIALLSLLVIPIVWWIARTIGGAAAGLTAGLMAATSASLIGYATFIWNPTIIEPAAAIAFLGTWQAIRTRRAAWWVVAAVGAALVSQAHVAAGVIVLPLGVTFLVDLSRGPAARRRRILGWGLAGVAIFVATYLPVIVWEMSNNFAETRGIVAYFTQPSGGSSSGVLLRLVFATIRILAWPLTRWPMIDLKPAFMPALTLASAVLVGLVWRVGATLRRKPDGRTPRPSPPDQEVAASDLERLGVRLIGGWLFLIILALGLGLHAVSEVQELPTEQYHVVADPLVLVAVGLIVGGLWRAVPARGLAAARRWAAAAFVVVLVAWNAGHWPPLTSADGGWPAAQAAATRIEHEADGSTVAFVPLFAAKGSDAYSYPLALEGVSIETPEKATIIVVLCDTFWTEGCDGSAEEAWLAQSKLGGLLRIDRFHAAPDRILTVYRKVP